MSVCVNNKTGLFYFNQIGVIPNSRSEISVKCVDERVDCGVEGLNIMRNRSVGDLHLAEFVSTLGQMRLLK